MFGRSLSFRLVAGIILIEIAMLSILVWDNARAFSQTSLHQLEETARSVLKQYTATSGRYVESNDLASLSELSNRLTTQFDIVFISVLDHDAQPLLTVGNADLAEDFTVDDHHEAVTDSILDLEREMSFAGRYLGTVRIGFSTVPLEVAVRNAVLRGIAVSVAIVLLTVLLGAMIGRRITANLRKLASAAETYGAGKIELDLPDGQSDEVGAAARAFRKMVRDREKAEHAVADSEKRLRDIADNVEDVVWVNSPDFSETLYVNRAFEKIFGLALEDIQNDPNSWANSMAPAEAEKLQRTIEDVLAKARSGDIASIRRFEYPIYKVEGSDGITRDIFARSVAMMGNDGSIERFVGVATDVTQLLRAQEDLRSSNERLLQSQKMEAVGQLTGGIAHDFNNLLAVILGNLELIEDAANPEEIQDYLDAAVTATSRGADLTKSLLSFARQSRLEPAVIDINLMVRETKNWSARVIPASIDVELSLLAGLWKTEVDAGLAQNALLNLILNARDAMPLGGKMTIETANVRIDEDYNEPRGEDVDPGRYVMLAVSDTGDGISKENLAQIFDPFFTTKPVGMGSGLGLSMVQGFLKQSGGTVRVYSEVGVGTTFKLFFKAVSGKHDEPAREYQATRSTPRTGARLFVVEDEEAVLDVLTGSLEKAGYHITSARSGDEAMRKWGHDPHFDLLITDIVMPGNLQGTQLARALRDRHPKLPVVFMSGYASEATVHGNGLRPEDIRLMKPVRRVDLLSAVERALKSVE